MRNNSLSKKSPMPIFTIRVLFACKPDPTVENLISNGDFSIGSDNWVITNGNSFALIERQAHINIVNRGATIDDVDFYYSYNPGILFEKNKSYHLAFSAYTPGNRSLKIQIVSTTIPPIFTVFEKIITLQNIIKTYSYNFDYNLDTSSSGTISFYCDNDSDDFNIDNIAITEN